jgi:hypothetical protein
MLRSPRLRSAQVDGSGTTESPRMSAPEPVCPTNVAWPVVVLIS